jgi:hypothetical protein
MSPSAHRHTPVTAHEGSDSGRPLSALLSQVLVAFDSKGNVNKIAF